MIKEIIMIIKTYNFTARKAKCNDFQKTLITMKKHTEPNLSTEMENEVEQAIFIKLLTDVMP